MERLGKLADLMVLARAVETLSAFLVLLGEMSHFYVEFCDAGSQFADDLVFFLQ